MIGHYQGATQVGGHAAHAVIEHSPAAQHAEKQPKAVANGELGQGTAPLAAQTERQQRKPEQESSKPPTPNRVKPRAVPISRQLRFNNAAISTPDGRQRGAGSARLAAGHASRPDSAAAGGQPTRRCDAPRAVPLFARRQHQSQRMGWRLLRQPGAVKRGHRPLESHQQHPTGTGLQGADRFGQARHQAILPAASEVMGMAALP